MAMQSVCALGGRTHGADQDTVSADGARRASVRLQPPRVGRDEAAHAPKSDCSAEWNSRRARAHQTTHIVRCGARVDFSDGDSDDDDDEEEEEEGEEGKEIDGGVGE
jgi:hypothetical protein